MREDRWHIYEDHSGEWRWKRIAPNGEVVGASTESYVNKTDCISNAERNGMPGTTDNQETETNKGD